MRKYTKKGNKNTAVLLLLFALTGMDAPPPSRQGERPLPLSATELAPLLRHRKTSSLELSRRFLRELNENGKESVKSVTEELALAQAGRADRELASGRVRSPLHGIPFGIEDLLLSRGTRPPRRASGTAGGTAGGTASGTASGTATSDPGRIPAGDVTVLRRLEEAGAVMVGWFRKGKSAGAITAGLAPFAIGSEEWEELAKPPRPGLTMLFPTPGRVSKAGCTALTWSTGRISLICRSAEECAILLDAIAGPDGIDPALVEAPFLYRRNISLRSVAVGFLKSPPGTLAESDRRLLAFLRARGARVIAVDPPLVPEDFSVLTRRFDIVLGAPSENLLRLSAASGTPRVTVGARGPTEISFMAVGRPFDEGLLLGIVRALQEPAHRPTRRVPVPAAE